jgi:hypothetical protein
MPALKKHFIDPFGHLSNILLSLRTAGYNKHLDAVPGRLGSHIPENINRNNAALLMHLHATNRCYGDDWVGVSGKSGRSDAQALGLKVLHSAKAGFTDVTNVFGFQTALQNYFTPEDELRSCSEVALINGLHHAITAYEENGCGADTSQPCTLYLLTERLPCKSCSNLLSKFLCKYQSTTLHLGYMFEPLANDKERDVYEFLEEMKVRTFAYKLQLLSAGDRGGKTGGKSQWLGPPKSRRAAETCEDVLHILRVKGRPSARIQTSVIPQERSPGQVSPHFMARIGVAGNVRHPRSK